ncbi:MAG: ammonia channel protein, partial [Simplicispira sp.]|nr:ammonia channel protein [Simplicispira sp.]
MKKLLASFVLGLGLLAGGPLALAQTPAATDPAPVVAPADPAAPALAPAPAAAQATQAEPVAPAEAAPTEPAATPKPDSGDTAWMLISTVLVILMVIPGLALFYGGLARSKNMLSVLVQVFVIFALITLLWAVYGYSLTFAGEGRFFGGLDKLFLKGIAPDTLSGLLPTIPEYVFVAFQSTFAAITVALIVGSFAERIKFAAVLIFAVLWFTLSYIPVAHMVWGGGLLAKDGALDFAG